MLAFVAICNASDYAIVPSQNPVTGSSVVLDCQVGGSYRFYWGGPPDEKGEPTILPDVSFSNRGPQGNRIVTATFSRSGTYNICVRVLKSKNRDWVLAGTGSITIVVQQTPRLVVLPATTSTFRGNLTQFSVARKDQFGQILAPVAVAWTTTGGGAITSGGSFSANALGGPFTISASGGGLVGTAAVSVLNRAPVIGAVTATGTTSGKAVALVADATDDAMPLT